MSAVVTPPRSLQPLLAGLVAMPVIDCPITGLASDSRQVRKGDLFLATRGLRHHGLEFLPAVRRAGAAAAVWEPPYAGGMVAAADFPLVAVEDLGQKLGLIASRFYGEPVRHLELVGITGTDGKTSCAHFIAQSLSEEGHTCGILGTLGYGVYGHTAPSSHTTPDALTLQRLLADFRAQGVRSVVMEVSSHALEQGRVAGLDFTVAVLTNLTRDHLDYHGSLAAYAQAKQRLFVDHRPRHVVLNADDAFGWELAANLRGRTPIVRYGLERALAGGPGRFVAAKALELTPTGLSLWVTSSWGEGTLQAPLLGRFNAGNLLAALATLLVLEVPFAEALRRLSRVITVPGRMECLGGKGGQPLAVVDYAHTPYALEKALSALKEHGRGRLWCVFGCGGDRDPGKRAPMGRIAERYADRVIVTDDNPRSEDPQRIIRAILAGMQHPGRVSVLRERNQAITEALNGATAEDIVLIAGKGHEDYQLLGTERLPFSDRAVVCQWLEDRIWQP